MSGCITRLVLEARRRRVRLYLDNRYAFNLAPVVAAKLRLGQSLSQAEVERLQADDELEVAHARAMRLVARRPRSRLEVQQHLAKNSVPLEVAERVLARLGDAGWVDDAAFARAWRDNREAFRPRSRRALQDELRRKGVAPDVAATALADLNDETTALRLGRARARRLVGLPRQEFGRRLSGYLARRGFDYQTVASVVEQCWGESDRAEDDES